MRKYFNDFKERFTFKDVFLQVAMLLMASITFVYFDVFDYIVKADKYYLIMAMLILTVLILIFTKFIKKIFNIKTNNIFYFDKTIVSLIISIFLFLIIISFFEFLNTPFSNKLITTISLELILILILKLRIKFLYIGEDTKISKISKNNIIGLEKLYNNDIGSLKLTKGEYILVDDDVFKEDLLDYKSFINSLYNVVLNCNPENSFKIGLIGSWGSGKSSIIKELQKRTVDAKNDRLKIINFSCWGHMDEKAAIKSLIKHVVNEIEIGYFSGEEKAIYDAYINKMMSVVNRVSPVDLLSIAQNNNYEDIIDEFKKSIEQNLKNTNSKLVIIIDDLDRVNEREIDVIFRCVANYFNFKNTIFIMCYDEKYIISQKKADFGLGDFDKVVNMKLYMPRIEKERISNIFSQSLKNLYLEYKKNNMLNIDLEFENAEEDIFKNGIIYRIGINFDNIRELKNFINIISVYMEESFFGLNAFDFIGIKFIEFKSEELFKKIYKNKEGLMKLKKALTLGDKVKMLDSIFLTKETSEVDKESYNRYRGILYFLFCYSNNKNSQSDEKWYRNPILDSKIINAEEHFDSFFSMISSSIILNEEIELKKWNNNNFNENAQIFVFLCIFVK